MRIKIEVGEITAKGYDENGIQATEVTIPSIAVEEQVAVNEIKQYYSMIGNMLSKADKMPNIIEKGLKVIEDCIGKLDFNGIREKIAVMKTINATEQKDDTNPNSQEVK